LTKGNGILSMYNKLGLICKTYLQEYTIFVSLLLAIYTLFLLGCSSEQSATLSKTANAATATVSNSTITIATRTTSSNVTPSNSSTPLPKLEWETRWLKGIPCSPPCWEGIIPGQTPANEVRKILELNPIITKLEQTLGYVDWEWGKESGGGSAVYDKQTQGQFIYSIDLEYPRPFTLNEITQAYGEPSNISASVVRDPEGTGASYNLYIIYLDKGFALIEDSRKEISFNSTLELKKLMFFIPGIDGYLKAMPGMRSDVKTWQGFKGFNFYCRAVGWKETEDCSKIPKSAP